MNVRRANVATVLAALLTGCGTSGATPAPTVPLAAPDTTVRAPAPAATALPAPAAARDAAYAVARGATRRLYARTGAHVPVPGATPTLLRDLDRFPMPRDLRGTPARATAVEVVRETPTRAVVWWVVVDTRTRTPLAVALERRGGSWRATGMLAD